MHITKEHISIIEINIETLRIVSGSLTRRRCKEGRTCRLQRLLIGQTHFKIFLQLLDILGKSSIDVFCKITEKLRHSKTFSLMSETLRVKIWSNIADEDT
jgi:ribonuclease PH